MEQKNNNKYLELFEQVKKLASLYLKDIKLTTAEKLTVLLSAIAVFAIVLVLAALFIVFAAMAIAQLLESVMGSFLAYMIVALFFLLLAVLFFAFRKELVFDPVARFLSGLFVDPPVDLSAHKSTSNNESHP